MCSAWSPSIALQCTTCYPDRMRTKVLQHVLSQCELMFMTCYGARNTSVYGDRLSCQLLYRASLCIRCTYAAAFSGRPLPGCMLIIVCEPSHRDKDTYACATASRCGVVFCFRASEGQMCDSQLRMLHDVSACQGFALCQPSLLLHSSTVASDAALPNVKVVEARRIACVTAPGPPTTCSGLLDPNTSSGAPASSP